MGTGQCLRFIVVNFSHLEAGVTGENQYPVPSPYLIPHLIQISAQVLPEQRGMGKDILQTSPGPLGVNSKIMFCVDYLKLIFPFQER